MVRAIGSVPLIVSPCRSGAARRIFVGFVAFLGAGIHSFSAAGAADKVLAPQDLVGRKVNLAIRSGERLYDVEVIKVRDDKATGSIRTITIRTEGSEETRTLVGSMVVSLHAGPGTLRYVYDEKTKRLLPDDPAIRARVEEVAKSPDPPVATRPVEKETPKEEQEEEEAALKNEKRTPKTRRKQDKKESALPEIPLRPHVRRWPEQSEEDRDKAIAEHKEFLKKIRENFPRNNFTFVETDYFLILSDLPPRATQALAPYLDTMYTRVLTMFNVKAGTNLFRGKGVVVLFANKASYVEFEVRMCNAKPETPQNRPALVNYESSGNALIAGHAEGKQPIGVIATMVHETTHAFLFRYKSKEHVPSWANEGLANVIESIIVPEDRQVAATEQDAIRHLRRGGPVGNFFDDKYIGLIGDPSVLRIKYGIAGNFTRYLIARDPRRYGYFIEGIKAGMKGSESLENAFGMKSELLFQEYGRSIGVQNLQP